jgi:hypothetical protein
VICKDSSIPDGFVVSGETVSDSCRGGTGWIIKRTQRPQGGLDRFALAASIHFEARRMSRSARHATPFNRIGRT